jgi:hypothetical protein
MAEQLVLLVVLMAGLIGLFLVDRAKPQTVEPAGDDKLRRQ